MMDYQDAPRHPLQLFAWGGGGPSGAPSRHCLGRRGPRLAPEAHLEHPGAEAHAAPTPDGRRGGRRGAGGRSATLQSAPPPCLLHSASAPRLGTPLSEAHGLDPLVPPTPSGHARLVQKRKRVHPRAPEGAPLSRRTGAAARHPDSLVSVAMRQRGHLARARRIPLAEHHVGERLWRHPTKEQAGAGRRSGANRRSVVRYGGRHPQSDVLQATAPWRRRRKSMGAMIRPLATPRIP